MDPDRIMVVAGTTVTWTSIDDATDHTITSGAPMAPEGKFDGRVARAGTFSHTFKEAGTFAYESRCMAHRSAGRQAEGNTFQRKSPSEGHYG